MEALDVHLHAKVNTAQTRHGLSWLLAYWRFRNILLTYLLERL